jgi:hypothetical protein
LPPLAAPAPGGFFDRENHEDIFVSFPSNSLPVSFAAQKVCVERANLETKKQGKSGEKCFNFGLCWLIFFLANFLQIFLAHA